MNSTDLKQRIEKSMLRASQQLLLCRLIDLAQQDGVVPYWLCDIAPQLGVHPSTLVRRLERLERAGLISRIPRAHQRSAVQINVPAVEHLPLRLKVEVTHG